MELSQLLHDFILGGLLGDKESEDWALAMLWPGLEGETGQANEAALPYLRARANSMSMFEPDDPSALPERFKDVPLDRRAPDDPRQQSALLAQIRRERFQSTLEREVYPRIGDDRFRPDGTLKRRYMHLPI